MKLETRWTHLVRKLAMQVTRSHRLACLKLGMLKIGMDLRGGGGGIINTGIISNQSSLYAHTHTYVCTRGGRNVSGFMNEDHLSLLLLLVSMINLYAAQVSLLKNSWSRPRRGPRHEEVVTCDQNSETDQIAKIEPRFTFKAETIL